MAQQETAASLGRRTVRQLNETAPRGDSACVKHGS